MPPCNSLVLLLEAPDAKSYLSTSKTFSPAFEAIVRAAAPTIPPPMIKRSYLIYLFDYFLKKSIF
jgi:hypothetical protein